MNRWERLPTRQERDDRPLHCARNRTTIEMEHHKRGLPHGRLSISLVSCDKIIISETNLEFLVWTSKYNIEQVYTTPPPEAVIVVAIASLNRSFFIVIVISVPYGRNMWAINGCAEFVVHCPPFRSLLPYKQQIRDGQGFIKRLLSPMEEHRESGHHIHAFVIS